MKPFDYEQKIYSGNGNISSALHFGIAETIRRKFGTKKGKLLDIGCGAGLYTNFLRKNLPHIEIHGIDISKNAIVKAGKNYPKIHFTSGSVYELPFPNNTFDIITVFCVLEHLESPEKALQEIRRVLKKNGIFYSITPVEGDRMIFFQSKALNKKFHGHVQRYTRKSLQFLFRNNGYQITAIHYWGFLFCQVITAIYIHALHFLKFPQSFSFESYLDVKSLTPKQRAIAGIKHGINSMINFESAVIPKSLPGLYMHILAKNNKE